MGYRSAIIALAWSPNSNLLAAGYLDGTVSTWSLSTGNKIKTIVANERARSDANGVDWSPDGRLLASTGQDAAVYVWDAETGAQVAALRGASLPMWSVAWSPDGSRLAAGNGRYEEASTGSTVFVLAMPEP